jgi:MFS family permease
MRRAPLGFVSGGLLIAAIAETWFLGPEHQNEFWWKHIYGSFALLGFLGCLAIVLLAKLVLGPWLQRKEDYYG